MLVDAFEHMSFILYTSTDHIGSVDHFFHLCIDNPLIHQAHKDISPWYQRRVVSLRTLW